MGKLTRIQLDRDYVKSIIPQTKTIKEMADLCGCGADTLRQFMRSQGLYKYYCEQHNIRYNPANDGLKCFVCGDNTCVQKYQGIPYCKKHYLQMYRHGKIYESTIYDCNEIKIEDDYAIVKVKDVKQNPKGESMIDIEDIDKIKNYKWYISYGYCVTKGVDHNNGIDMANVIFNDFENKYDHINHNRLDNRKINLRPVTSHQNAMNMGKKCTNTSGVTGVRQEDHCKTVKWVALLTYNYKTQWLGSYDTFDEAVKARLKGEIKYFEKYSPNYNPETNTIQLNYFSHTDKQNRFIEYSLEGELLQWY